MRCWLASFPRSGNTLARLLLSHHFGFNVPSLYGKEKVLEGKETRHLNRDPIEGVHTFTKCHFSRRYTTPGPALLVVRDVRDTLVSYAHYQQDFEHKGPFMGNLERLVEDSMWTEFHRHWLKRETPVEVVRYEDLLRAPVRTLETPLSLLLGKPQKVRSREPLPQFTEFHEGQPRFFRRGESGSWRVELPEPLEEICWGTHGAMMERLGYVR